MGGALAMVVTITVYEVKTIPLLCALENDRKDSVNVFLSAEVIDRVDKDNKSQLHYATEYGHTESVETLLSAGAKVDIVDKDNKTPLQYAVEKGDNKSVEALLSAGANVEVVDKEGENALNMVLQYPKTMRRFDNVNKSSALNVMKLLLDKNISLDNVDRRGKTPLQYIDSNIGSAGTITNFYKEAKLLLLKAIQQRENSELMAQEGDKVDTTKIYFCGHGGVGKTTLKETLKKVRLYTLT
uniref:Inversin-B-like n=1 Tax=Saccoglossus kowalevskii TaxID=10224 RepID=A0ABM0LZC6_SACKO|nr:PREDICTED: inversin-B-like [Saccoglossus kowalevskii]